METTYYLKVNIESAGTEYTGGGLIPKSLAGHMWYEIYQKDSNGNIIPASGLNAGYTGHGITKEDAQNYAGDPAYSSNEIAITQEQFNTLFKFGTNGSTSSTQNGFGNDDYNVLNNSCIDYVWKALELVGINKTSYEGDLIPMNNTNDIDNLVLNINYASSLNSIDASNLNLNSITTVSGGYGDIINVKDTLGNDVFIVPDEYGNKSVYDNNGQLDMIQSSAILNTLNSNIKDNWSDTQQNLYDWKSNGSLGSDLYLDLSKTITTYLISSNPNGNYANLVNSGYFDNSYLNPISIGAFYESSTSQIDNSVSIAQKTYRLLNSSNQTITKEQLNALDLNKDGKLSGTEISTLKTWKDLNEDGIAQTGEITSLTETIYSKDYDTLTKGNSIFQNPTTPTQPVKQSATYTTPSSDNSTIIKTVSVPISNNSIYGGRLVS